MNKITKTFSSILTSFMSPTLLNSLVQNYSWLVFASVFLHCWLLAFQLICLHHVYCIYLYCSCNAAFGRGLLSHPFYKHIFHCTFLVKNLEKTRMCLNRESTCTIAQKIKGLLKKKKVDFFSHHSVILGSMIYCKWLATFWQHIYHI